jgi:hypothetical protein
MKRIHSNADTRRARKQFNWRMRRAIDEMKKKLQRKEMLRRKRQALIGGV